MLVQNKSKIKIRSLGKTPNSAALNTEKQNVKELYAHFSFLLSHSVKGGVVKSVAPLK